MKFNALCFVIIGLSLSCVSAFTDVKNDDTGVNRQDLAANEFTSDDAPSTKNDEDITRRIRQGVVADRTLSLYAHNVKIITEEGQVVLRGPVRSRAEETKIVSVAQKVAGLSRVIDRLQISKRDKRRIL